MVLAISYYLNMLADFMVQDKNYFDIIEVITTIVVIKAITNIIVVITNAKGKFQVSVKEVKVFH